MGFAELEHFDLNLNSKFRSKHFKDRVGGKSNDSSVVGEAMTLIIRDEEKYLNEQYKERETMSKNIARIYTKNSRTYRRILKTLKIEANKNTQEMTMKYKTKTDHLRKKFREDDKTKIMKLPKGLEEFSNLSVFDQDEFDKIFGKTLSCFHQIQLQLIATLL